MDPFTLEILGAVVRWALTGFGMYLVQHHVLNETQAAGLTERAGTHLLLALPFIAPLVWSLWAKVRARVKLNTAMAGGPTTERELKEKIAYGLGAGVSAVTLLLALTLGAGVLTASACAPKTWAPATQQAFNKDGLIKSLGALQHAAIALSEARPPVIPLADAALVVEAVGALLDGADAAGSGILGTTEAVLRTLTQGRPDAGVRPRLSPATLAALGPMMQGVRDELAKWGRP